MPSYRTSATIKRPISEVFAYLTDVSAWPKWMNVETTQPTDAGPPAVGSKAEGTLSEGGKHVPFSIEITRLEQDQFIGFRTMSGPMDWQGGWEVRALDAQTTEVTSVGQMHLHGIKRLLEPLMAGEIRKSEAAELVKLRGILES